MTITGRSPEHDIKATTGVTITYEADQINYIA